jgi:hypothetical protein
MHDEARHIALGTLTTEEWKTEQQLFAESSFCQFTRLQPDTPSG